MSKIFNLEAYYSRLRTLRLGRPCIYLDQVGSTVDVASQEQSNTLVLAREQLNGRGQRGNIWQSPVGCAMGSMRFACNKASYLATRLCFLQHIVSLAAAKTLEQMDSKRLGKDRIKLKWPNDIIYTSPVADSGPLKIGGILVHTKEQGEEYDVVLSFGLNVLNSQPTTCVSDIIGSKEDISIDSIVADLLNNLEDYISDLTDQKFEEIKADYTERCALINKVVDDENNGPVKVKKVNNDGYLVGERCLDHKTCLITKIVNFY